MFHKIEDASVVLASGGVYRYAPLFVHNGQVFAKFGSGYVKLMKSSGGTSKGNVSWSDFQGDFTPEYDALQRMVYKAAP
jgi:hypothetical protein